MNVKVFSISPATLSVEEVLQKWLNDNANVSIEHVTVSPMVRGHLRDGTDDIWPDAMLVTIFYRD